MKILGVTGGVGSGKSSILEYLEKNYGAKVYQADAIAHKLQEPHNQCYERIVEHFGRVILNADSTIDRSILGSIVFRDSKELSVLNQIVHPEVKSYILDAIKEEQQLGTGLYVLEAALLLEDNYDEICDDIWYIFADEQTRRMRLKADRGYSEQRINTVLQSQLSEVAFKSKCHVTIDNSGALETTYQQIDQLMEKYIS